MKKRILMITAAVMGTMLSLNTAYASGVKYKYTSRGVYVPVGAPGSDFIAMDCMGAIVEADFDMFNFCSVHAGVEGEDEYACYAGNNTPETLTLGFKSLYEIGGGYNLEPGMEALQLVVADQISYVKHIGGVMTGYSFDDNGIGREAVNISWNIGTMHHYARFEFEGGGGHSIGYYDLMYTDSSDVDIAAMNNSFCVAYEVQ